MNVSYSYILLISQRSVLTFCFLFVFAGGCGLMSKCPMVVRHLVHDPSTLCVCLKRDLYISWEVAVPTCPSRICGDTTQVSFCLPLFIRIQDWKILKKINQRKYWVLLNGIFSLLNFTLKNTLSYCLWWESIDLRMSNVYVFLYE